METDYENSEDGCRAFVSWLISQAATSAAWKHIHADDKRDLEKAASILEDDPAVALSTGKLKHEGLWRLLGAAFMVGRCSNFAELDVAYYHHVRRPADNRTTKAEKRDASEDEIKISEVVTRMSQRWDGSRPYTLAASICDKLAEQGVSRSKEAIHSRLKKLRPSS